MEKQRAIVDTCFLQKISSQGSCSGNIKRILDNSDYIPVAHKYVVEQELSLHSYLGKLVEEEYIITVEYEEFLKDDFSKMVYETQFVDIYDEMRNYLKCAGGIKQMPELNIPKGKSIYTHHIGGSSMGDVHMILMASFMGLPVFLSEDSDIELLRDIAKRRLSLSSYQLQIYDTVNILEQIAGKNDLNISHKEFKSIVKQAGEHRNWARINAIWNANH